MMNVREFNRKKNLYIRSLKSRVIKLLVDRKKKAPFELSAIKKVIFLRNDNKLGDMVVSTASFREAKMAGYSVSVIASTNTAALLQPNPNIDAVYISKKGLINTLKLAFELRKCRFDLLIDIGEEPRAETLLLMAIMSPKHLLGFNKDNYKMYDVSLMDKIEEKNHISYRHRASLAKLGIVDVNLRYDLHIPKAIEKEAKDYLSHLNKKTVVVNLFTASKHRDMSIEQLKYVVATLHRKFNDLVFILVGTPNRLKGIAIDGVNNTPFPSLFHTVALIKHADAVLSPDTAIVHLAQAFHKPLVTLYLANDIEVTKWRVNYENARLLFTKNSSTDVCELEPQLIVDEMRTVIEALP